MKLLSKLTLLTALQTLVLAPPLPGATRTWNGSANGYWSTPGNWGGGVAPSAGDTLLFPMVDPSRRKMTNNYILGTARFHALRFEGSGYTLSGAVVALANGIDATHTSGLNTIQCDLELRADQQFKLAGSLNALFELTGGITLHGHSLSVAVDLGDRLAIRGPISGPGRLSKSDPGTLLLAGTSANTYDGDTTVANGILELDKFILINGQPSPRVAIPGNLLVGAGYGGAFNARVLCRQNNQIATSAEVSVNFDGRLELGDRSNTVSDLLVIGGRIETGAGTLTLGGSNLVFTGLQGSHISGHLHLGDAPQLITVTPEDTVATISAVITGGPAATLNKLGEGELRLTSPNAYVGATVLRQGRLQASASSAFGSGPAGVTVLNGAPVVVRGTELILSNATITGKTLTLEKQGLALSSTGLANVWSGPVVLNDFVTVETRGVSQLEWNGPVSGPGGLFKRGPGLLALAGPGPNTYGGFTRAAEGTLTLAKANAIALPGPLSVGEGAGASGVVRLIAGSTSDVTNQIADHAAVEIRATGKLVTGHSERIGALAGVGSLQLEATLEVGSNDDSTSFGGPISGLSGGSLRKIGAGTLTLSGTCSQDNTWVEAGRLEMYASHFGSIHVLPGAVLGGLGPVGRLVLEGGALEPDFGSSGFILSGDLANASAPSVVRLDLSSTPSATDRLQIGGQVNLANISLALQLPPAASVPPGTSFKIIDKLGGGSPIASPFEALPEGAVINVDGQSFQISYQAGNGNDVVLTRGVSLVSSGLRHTALGLATIAPISPSALNVGNLGGSGEDGIVISLGAAQGWQGRVTLENLAADRGWIGWNIAGALGGRMELSGTAIQVFADPASATEHWVEFFAGSELLLGTRSTSNASVFHVLPNSLAALATDLRIEGPFPGQPYWVSELAWSVPQRLALSSASASPLSNVTRVRIRPWPLPILPVLAGTEDLPPLSLHGADRVGFRLSDESLLFTPLPPQAGIAHRPLGQAQISASHGALMVSHLGSSGRDGVSIDVDNGATGLAVGLAPFDLSRPGTALALQAVGIFGHEPNHSMGSARLVSVPNGIQVWTDFEPVGSDSVRAEIVQGGVAVGSVLARTGLAATIRTSTPPGQFGLPGLDAVAWVPPGLRPFVDAGAQTDSEPLPCYLFHFNGPVTFDLVDGQHLIGDSLRLVSTRGEPRAQALTRLEVTIAISGPETDPQIKLQFEAPRLPPPVVTRLSPSTIRTGDTIEIVGHGFGNSAPALCVVGSAMVDGRAQATVPFEVISAADSRILARVGWAPAGTASGPVLVHRGVGHEGLPAGDATGIILPQPIRAWREGGSAASPSLRVVYDPPSLIDPHPICSDSGPPQDGVLVVHLGPELIGARVQFNAHVTAVMPAGRAQVSASDVRFFGAADELEAAQRLARLLELTFAQQAGLIVQAQASRPSAANFVKLTLRIPAGPIVEGFLNVCASEVDLIPQLAIRVTDGQFEVLQNVSAAIEHSPSPAGPWTELPSPRAGTWHLVPARSSGAGYFRFRTPQVR